MSKVSKKEIVREVCKDASDLAKDIAPQVGELSFVLASPILGNLSKNLQERIEKISKGLYDSTMSTRVTYVSNPVIYTVLGGYYSANYLSPNSELEGIFTGLAMTVGIIGGALESSIRAEINYARRKKESYGTTYGIASVPGKIISLPFDIALYTGRIVKNYLDEITARIGRRKSQEDKK